MNIKSVGKKKPEKQKCFGKPKYEDILAQCRYKFKELKGV